MRTRRQCDGVPEIAVTPWRASRASWSPSGSSGLVSTRSVWTEDGAQENLQAAVAADIVECGPDRPIEAGWRLGDGAGEGTERVGNEFRATGRARCRHHPFRILVTDGRLRGGRPEGDREHVGHEATVAIRHVRRDRLDFGVPRRSRQARLGSRSGGAMVSRRASPSSSTSAIALAICVPVATRTDRPSARSRPAPRYVPVDRAARSTPRSRSRRRRPPMIGEPGTASRPPERIRRGHDRRTR